jgi:hypothetical protein
VGRPLDLPGPPQKPLALNARWGASGLFAQTFGLFLKAFIEGIYFFERVSLLLHGAAPMAWAGALSAFSPRLVAGRDCGDRRRAAASLSMTYAHIPALIQLKAPQAD